jgi:hypothetical protein
MTDTLSIGDMFEELMRDYHESMHEYEDEYNPEWYEEYLNSLNDEDFITEYESRFGGY